MLQIKRAQKKDLAAIKHLMGAYGLFTLTDAHLNSRDIALKAVDTETGAIVGFVWGGLMAQNTQIYIDKATVHPAYSRKGVLNALYTELLQLGIKLGVKSGFGIIKRDEFHDKSAINALKMAFAADSVPYTYVYGDPERMLQELSMLRAS